MDILNRFQYGTSYVNQTLDAPMYPIFILILIISANFLAQLFPCRIQEVLQDNMLIKHIFGFLTLVFFVVTDVKQVEKSNSLTTLLSKSVLIYAIFVMTTRTSTPFFLAILVMLGIQYILTIRKMFVTKSNDTAEVKQQKIKQAEMFQRYAYYIAIILIIFGFLNYLGSKKVEHGKNFSYYKFMLQPECTGRTLNVKMLKALRNALRSASNSKLSSLSTQIITK